MTPTGEVFQKRHALAERRFEGDLAAHGTFRNGRDFLLQPHVIGQFVDAFLADHGGIHVRQEQALPARRRRLDDNVDGFVAQGDANGRFGRPFVAFEVNVGGDSPCEDPPFRLLSERPRGSIDQGVGENRAGRVGDESRDETD